jgi:hypothetical protein
MVHDATVGIDALDVAPVRPAGPTRAALQAYDTPSRDGLTGGEGAGTLGHQQSLGDGVRAEIAFLVHVRPHGL